MIFRCGATALAIKLPLVTAQRIGEVAGIALSELHLNDTAPMWVVPGERSKKFFEQAPIRSRRPVVLEGVKTPLSQSPNGKPVVSRGRFLRGIMSVAAYESCQQGA